MSEEDSGYETSPEKAEKEEFRNFVEEPGDDDGENRHPTEFNSMLYTALLIVKNMIGAGILNLPLIVKTFGIIGASILTVILAFIAITVAYYLGRCKDITQRYSFAVYSKIMMGATGTFIMKTALIIMTSTIAIVQLICYGDLLKGLTMLFYDINTKLLIVEIALVILPFIFQKDISGIAKIAHFGIFGLSIFCGAHIILFVNKYQENKIIFDKSMLYPNGTFKDIILCIGSYYNAFAFHLSYFSFYLPLKPRNNKTMMKSCTIGALTGGTIYLLYGIMFYLMYGTQISDSALKYLQAELAESYKNNDMFITGVIVICFLSFLLNASISTMLYIFFFKSHLIGLIKLVLKKKIKKVKDENNKDSIKESEELLSEKKQTLITLGCFVYILCCALGFNKIIILDSFNGATVANYINIIAPCMFYLYFSKGSKNFGEKALSSFNVMFGSFLIISYFVTLFY